MLGAKQQTTTMTTSWWFCFGCLLCCASGWLVGCVSGWLVGVAEQVWRSDGWVVGRHHTHTPSCAPALLPGCVNTAAFEAKGLTEPLQGPMFIHLEFPNITLREGKARDSHEVCTSVCVCVSVCLYVCMSVPVCVCVIVFTVWVRCTPTHYTLTRSRCLSACFPDCDVPHCVLARLWPGLSLLFHCSQTQNFPLPPPKDKGQMKQNTHARLYSSSHCLLRAPMHINRKTSTLHLRREEDACTVQRNSRSSFWWVNRSSAVVCMCVCVCVCLCVCVSLSVSGPCTTVPHPLLSRNTLMQLALARSLWTE